MKEKRNACKTLVINFGRKWPLGRWGRIWEYTSKMNIRVVNGAGSGISGVDPSDFATITLVN
jgi:hypothetical protein